MSKIGKINISIPEKVKVALAGSNLNIEGPLGKKSLNIDLNLFSLDIKDGKAISIKPRRLIKTQKGYGAWIEALLTTQLLARVKGYEKILELTGVGYRAALKGKILNLQLGFSHDINFEIPEGIKIQVEKQNILKISGNDKQQVGMVAAEIKGIRPPEPYKGKGIKEQGQHILRKEGKKK